MNFSPVQKAGIGVEQTAVRRSGDRAAQAVLAAIAWLGTYNAAVIRGDDVNHLSAPLGNLIFLPNFAPGWIPNRLVDLYGRNLLSRVFDVTFFPAHALTGVDFFHWYKIFNATLFTVFLLVVHRGVMARIGGQPGALVSLFAAFAVLLIMPWTNEVRAICYELPAFLLFVVAGEMFTLLQGKAPPPSWLLAIGFVVAFSLEGTAAILLGTLAVMFLLARPWRAPKFWRSDAAVLGGLIAAFCAVALLTTVAFSQRAAVSETFVPFKQYAIYLKGGAFPPPDPVLYAQMLALGIAGLAAIALSRHRFAALCGFTQAPYSGPLAATARAFGLFAISGSVTLVVAALISMEANQNFFWFRVYPWAGLLITAMLFGLVAIAAPLAANATRPPLLEAVVIVVVAVAISRMAMAAIGQAAIAYNESEQVEQAYTAALRTGSGVVPTGLNLDATEMARRDLPTADSPLWFIDGYRELFLKYYGIWTTAVFR